MRKWTLEQFQWDKVDPAQADADILMLVKTASLVEYNSADYTAYLKNVFAGDAEFAQAAEEWGDEERAHGLALKRWAEIVDPSFDFEKSLARFRDAFRVNVNAETSIRGSRARELVARCVVESGTTSYYSALRDATRDSVLKEICHWIAIDEIRHFNLFYDYLARYQPSEGLGIWGRTKVILERSGEVDDEELSFAFAAANFDQPVDKSRLKEYATEYLRRAYSIYEPRHVAKAMSLILRASGVGNRPWLVRLVSKISHAMVKKRTRRMNRQLALHPV